LAVMIMFVGEYRPGSVLHRRIPKHEKKAEENRAIERNWGDSAEIVEWQMSDLRSVW